MIKHWFGINYEGHRFNAVVSRHVAECLKAEADYYESRIERLQRENASLKASLELARLRCSDEPAFNPIPGWVPYQYPANKTLSLVSATTKIHQNLNIKEDSPQTERPRAFDLRPISQGIGRGRFFLSPLRHVLTDAEVKKGWREASSKE